MKISRTRSIALGAVAVPSQSRRKALISVSENPRSCSFWIQSIRLTRLAASRAGSPPSTDGRVEQAELLVEVHRPDGLPGPLGQLADFQKREALRGDVVETLTHTYGLYIKPLR